MDNLAWDDPMVSNEELALRLMEIADRGAHAQHEYASNAVSRGYISNNDLASTDYLPLEPMSLANELRLDSNRLFRNDNPPKLTEGDLDSAFAPPSIRARLRLTRDETPMVMQKILMGLSLPTIRKATSFAVLLAYAYRERFEKLTIQEREAYATERLDNTPFCPDIKVEEAATRCLTAIMNGIYQARIHYAFCGTHIKHMKYVSFDTIVVLWLEGQRGQVLRMQNGHLPANLPAEQHPLITALFQKAHVYNADVEMVMRTQSCRETLRRLTDLALEEPGPDHEDNWRAVRGFPPCERNLVHTEQMAVRPYSYFGDLDPRMPMGLESIGGRRWGIHEWFPISRSFDIPRKKDDPARKEGLDEWQALELGTPGTCIVDRKEGHGF